ncbi:MAG: HAMP domain-containing histidine kinase [Acetatifactor sp.]|nr:HAMP domain-containing histidine kinase [Acetatifactor sp.]
MRNFDKMFAALVLIIILLCIGINAVIATAVRNDGNRFYQVEINRLCRQLEDGKSPDLSVCTYVTGVRKYNGSKDFFDSNSSYVIREIDGTFYRFDYLPLRENTLRLLLLINIPLLMLLALFLGVMFYLRRQLLKPFDKLVNVPYELSKGILTTPLEENRSRFFGRFVWGINMLRETMENQKQRELSLQKEKQTLLLSISHDIKTPLSAIKLYASALSRGLYQDPKKQLGVSLRINEKVDEIEHFVSDLSLAARKDFLQLEVNLSEFYLSEAITSIASHYSETLALNRTVFTIDPFTDCIVTGDVDRSIEVLQNIVENAIKYGDGREIHIGFSNEENGRLVTVTNTGSTLSESELIHIFDSFWRGSNSAGKSGTGLGLYICRQLMLKMGGEIFAQIKENEMCVTLVFRMA